MFSKKKETKNHQVNRQSSPETKRLSPEVIPPNNNVRRKSSVAQVMNALETTAKKTKKKVATHTPHSTKPHRNSSRVNVGAALLANLTSNASSSNVPLMTFKTMQALVSMFIIFNSKTKKHEKLMHTGMALIAMTQLGFMISFAIKAEECMASDVSNLTDASLTCRLSLIFGLIYNGILLLMWSLGEILKASNDLSSPQSSPNASRVNSVQNSPEEEMEQDKHIENKSLKNKAQESISDLLKLPKNKCCQFSPTSSHIASAENSPEETMEKGLYIIDQKKDKEKVEDNEDQESTKSNSSLYQ